MRVMVQQMRQPKVQLLEARLGVVTTKQEAAFTYQHGKAEG